MYPWYQDPQHSIVFQPGQVRDSYHNQDDVVATLFHCWTATTHQIASITPSNQTLTLLKSPHVDIPRCEHASGKRFLIENSLEDLSVGEFYFDGQSKELMYLPKEGEQLSDFTLWAPQIITVVSIDGASNVIVQNLSIAHAAADMSGFFQGDCDGQSATNLRSAAVQVNCSAGVTCHSVTIRDVEIAHTGGTGITVGGAVNGVTLERLTVHDVGAGGARIGTVALTPVVDTFEGLDTPTSATHAAGAALGLTVNGVTLADSQLWDGGHVYRMGPGLQMDDCIGCSITHNHIHDFWYTGISSGYGFHDGYIQSTQLSYNQLNNIGSSSYDNGLSDLGCIYSWGGSQSLHVDHNLCFNVSSYNYGGWGFYNDQTTQVGTLPLSFHFALVLCFCVVMTDDSGNFVFT